MTISRDHLETDLGALREKVKTAADLFTEILPHLCSCDTVKTELTNKVNLWLGQPTQGGQNATSPGEPVQSENPAEQMVVAGTTQQDGN